MTGSRLFRVLDVNLNRAREGLRVCEEVARLVLEDPSLTRRCQRLRYAVDKTGRLLPRGKLLKARDSQRDIGRPEKRGPVGKHKRVRELASANLKRAQEALRVLEEFSRLVYPAASRSFGSLRFKAYSLEKAFDQRSKTVRHR